MGSKAGRTTNYSEEDLATGNIYWRDLTEKIVAWKTKGTTAKEQALEEIMKKIHTQNPNGIKRDMSQLQRMLGANETP